MLCVVRDCLAHKIAAAPHSKHDTTKTTRCERHTGRKAEITVPSKSSYCSYMVRQCAYIVGLRRSPVLPILRSCSNFATASGIVLEREIVRTYMHFFKNCLGSAALRLLNSIVREDYSSFTVGPSRCDEGNGSHALASGLSGDVKCGILSGEVKCPLHLYI